MPCLLRSDLNLEGGTKKNTFLTTLDSCIVGGEHVLKLLLAEMLTLGDLCSSVTKFTE